MTDNVTPTQADREAGMDLLGESWLDRPIDDVFANAFARHRLEAIATQAAALMATAEAAATHLKAKMAADAEIARLRGLLSSQTIIAALVQGLHAQVFGVRSMGDPQLSHDALADNGQLHEAVHALVEALPPYLP